MVNGIEVNVNEENNTKRTGVIKLLLERLENILYTDKMVIIHISNPYVNCSNTINVDDIEVDDKEICLSNDDYQLHIKTKDVDIKYIPAGEGEELDDKFVLSYGHGIEIDMLFLD